MQTNYLKLLGRALMTLKPEQGPVARRNARARVRNALKALTDDIDTRFPAPARKVGPRKRRTLAEKRRDLIRAGYLLVNDRVPRGVEFLGWVAAQKMPVATTTAGESVASATWVPGWVAHYYPNASVAQKARRTVSMITAADAAIRLGSLTEKGFVLCPVR